MFLKSLEPFITTIFPQECQSCGKTELEIQSKLCSSCKAQLHEHRFNWEDSWHPHAIKGLRSVFSAFEYAGKVKSLLHQVKFRHQFYLLESLTNQASDLFQAITAETHYDAIIPMPIDFPRRWNRRYNQTELIASHLCPPQDQLIHPGLLGKRLGFRPQHGLKKDARLWNIIGAFKVKNARAIQGKTFLLIDDIITTGSTASEAASVLLKHGAKKIDLFTLARSTKSKLDKATGVT